jgi:flagellar hook-length control protein FliK
MPERLMRGGSEPAPRSVGQDHGTAEATRVATAIGESQQVIQEEMATELRVQRMQAAVGTEHGSRQAERKGSVFEAVAANAGEGTVAVRAQAMSPSTSGNPQFPAAAMEPQLQVAQRFVIMTANGESRTRLNLYPPELGKLQIDISLESNRLSAILVTETQVVKELMEAHLGQLRQHLAQHNLQLENFQVTVGADASPYKESNHGLFGSGKHSRQSEVTETAIAAGVSEFGVADHSHALAGSGRIDLFA